jgi:7-cyano-7-deazaguanine synthase in queuosine biosynthesis
MSKQHHILCGGSAPAAKLNTGDVLRLNLWGGGADENVQLRIEDLHKTLYRDIPPQFFDLVEIAAYVYCADQALKRTRQDTDTFGGDWRRHLHFQIPVRCVDLWNRSDIKDALIQLLDFLSDDNFTFHFHRAERAPAFQQYLGFASEAHAGRDFERVIMFSGGLDSLAGVIEETLANKSRVVLVTHESTPKNTGLLRQLQRQLAEKAGPLKPLHLRVRANKEKRLGKEYTQRTRSFLFACFGVTVAKMMGLDTLRFYENGIVSLNLPVSAQVIGSRATRTTHPRTLAGFQKLFTLLGNTPFTVENPFLWATKADVIHKITKASCGEMISASSSCAHTWVRTTKFTHCGVCSQCIDRRLAVAAAHAEQFDPAGHYRTNIFVDPRPADDDKMMLAAYLDRATAVDEVASPAEFIAAFPQIVDAFPFVAGGATKLAGQFFDLYKRHAKEVGEALDIIIRSHSNYLVQGIGGGGCLLRTLLDSRGIDPSKLPEAAKQTEIAPDRAAIEFRGADWRVIFKGRDISVPDMIGMRYIAILLGSPGDEFRHSELRLKGSPVFDPDAAEAALQSGAARGIPSTDEKTLRAVKSELEAVLEEKAAARANGDTERLNDLEEREHKLKKYLGSTSDKAGAPRRTKGSHESARVSVVKAITAVRNRLKKAERNQPFLEHVNAIRPGAAGHLVYRPTEDVAWEISGPES